MHITVSKENQNYDDRNDCNAIIETKTNMLVSACRNTKIPNDIEIIGKGAFEIQDCSSELIIPNSVKIIAKNAFAKSDFYKITLPENILQIDENAFVNARNLMQITYKNTKYTNKNKLKNALLSNNVNINGNYLFHDTSLED